MLPSLEVLVGIGAQLCRLERGHCDNESWLDKCLMRAGVTSDMRNGKLAKKIPRLDSVV
jgi:hypothetical protein